MGHTPYGYIIENGRAFIDKEKASKIRKLYMNYITGMTLTNAAAKAGIETYHSTAKRLMENKHYLGDEFYPAIIDKGTFDKAAEERIRRTVKLGRLNLKKGKRTISPPTSFHITGAKIHYEDPKLEAENLYSLIRSEVS